MRIERDSKQAPQQRRRTIVSKSPVLLGDTRPKEGDEQRTASRRVHEEGVEGEAIEDSGFGNRITRLASYDATQIRTS